jgi:hypothetical protein
LVLGLADPPTNQHRLRLLTIRVSDATTLRIAIAGEALEFSGSRAGFSRLAHELEQYVEHNDVDEPGMHAHFNPKDYLAVNDEWIAVDSIPLMVSGWVPDRS